MILVTGGTGFIGQALIRQLITEGNEVRTLIRPSRRSPNLPKGVPVEVAVCSLADTRGLQAAVKGVQAIYHLASAEGAGAKADLYGVDIRGTEAVVQAAVNAGVERFFYLSHLGADRASAYPILKAKAIAESRIRQSGIPYTILRTAVIFGPGDRLTNGLVRATRLLPGLFFLPGDGSTLLQPLHVDDLVTCLVWALENPALCGQLVSIGGGETLSFREIVSYVQSAAGLPRQLVSISPPYLRMLAVILEHTLRNFPLSISWLDYLAASRTCPVDAIPRLFGLMPGRFNQQLGYLRTSARPRHYRKKKV